MKQDPIFALIEAHRAAYATEKAIVAELSPLERRLQKMGVSRDQESRHPLMIEHDKKNNAAGRAESRAMRKLCATKPTTLAGIAALTRYLLQAWNPNRPGCDRWDIEAPGGDFLEILLTSVADAADRLGVTQKSSSRVVPFKKAA